MNQFKVEGSGIIGNFRLNEDVFNINVAGSDQLYRLPNTAGNRTAPLRRFHWAHTIHPFILQQDRANDAQDQCIFPAGLDQLIYAKIERRESALVNTHRRVVQPDFGQVVDSIEMQTDNFAFPVCWNHKRAAVKSNTFVVFFR